MKFFNYLVVALILTLIIACEKDNQEIDIRGDWFTYQFSSDSLDSLKKDYYNFIYEEHFFIDSLIFTYINSSGYLNPSEYYLKKDSFFDIFSGSPDSEFGSNYRVKLLTRNHLIFYNVKDTTNYYRLTNTSDLLSNYIINADINNPRFSDSSNSFAEAFRKRSNNCYLKNK